MAETVSRKNFLNKLLCISPGLSGRESIQQSSCVVFKRGMLYSMSQEIACAISSSLPETWEGALPAETLIKMLKLMPEDEIELDFSASALTVKGNRKKPKFNLESNIILPIDEVERPKKADWQKLDAEFCEAVELVCKCTSKQDKDDFLKRCVHVHPEWLEAFDGIRYMRYTVPSPSKVPILVRGDSLKSIGQLGMTKGAETEGWFHFKNPLGLRLSIRKLADGNEYPDASSALTQRGRKLIFPKGLADAAQRAGLAAEVDSIRIKISKGEMSLYAANNELEHTEELSIKYKGDDLAFSVPFKLAKELAEDHTECEVCESHLRIDGGKYVYIALLEMEKP